MIIPHLYDGTAIESNFAPLLTDKKSGDSCCVHGPRKVDWVTNTSQDFSCNLLVDIVKFILSRLPPNKRLLTLAPTCRTLWALNIRDNPYWGKICHEGGYEPLGTETGYETFFRNRFVWILQQPEAKFTMQSQIVMLGPLRWDSGANGFIRGTLPLDGHPLFLEKKGNEQFLMKISSVSGEILSYKTLPIHFERRNMRVIKDQILGYSLDNFYVLAATDLTLLKQLCFTAIIPNMGTYLNDFTEMSGEYFFHFYDFVSESPLFYRLPFDSDEPTLLTSYVNDSLYFCHNGERKDLYCYCSSLDKLVVYDLASEEQKLIHVSAHSLEKNTNFYYPLSGHLIAQYASPMIHLWDTKNCEYTHSIRIFGSITAIHLQEDQLTICTDSSIRVFEIGLAKSILQEIGR